MKNGKRKCLKNYLIFQIIIILNFLGIVGCFTTLIIIFKHGIDNDFVIFISLFIGICIILPWLLCFIFQKQTFSIIVFSANGIEQRCFGKQINFFQWETVNNLKIQYYAAATSTFTFYSQECKISVLIITKSKVLQDVIALCPNENIKQALRKYISGE